MTFHATTVSEAIRRAKEELGPDALILDVRRALANGLVEVDAAIGQTSEFRAVDDPGERREPPPLIDLFAVRLGRAGRTTEPAAAPPDEPPPRSGGEAGPPPQADERDIAFIRQYGVSERLATELALACAAGSAVRRHTAVSQVLQRRIAIADDLAPTEERKRIVLALVGPTGVGKTTTIAKLATIFSATRRQRVALVTTDTYRVGGIAQLKTFAEILQLPFATVYTREDLETALAQTADAEVVLVDTPGCNPYDAAMLKELRTLIADRSPVQCYLTLAMSGDFQELIAASQRFALLNPVGLIATKLDETRRNAAVIGLAEQTRLPLAYTCAGPLVPEDIAVASPALLTDLLLAAMESHYRQELAHR